MVAMGQAISLVSKAATLSVAAAKLLEAVKKIRTTTGHPQVSALSQLKTRIVALEAYNEEQSELISQLAEQNQVLAERVSELEAKRKGFFSRFF